MVKRKDTHNCKTNFARNLIQCKLYISSYIPDTIQITAHLENLL